MVRAGVVKHPKEWINSGYNEIQNPKQRYNLLDFKRLPILFGYDSLHEFQKHHKMWIDEALENDRLERDSKWSESIAVGRKSFVEEVHKKPGYKVKGRQVTQVEESFLIREPVASYGTLFEGKNMPLRAENTYLWDLSL
jgi:putative transposase